MDRATFLNYEQIIIHISPPLVDGKLIQDAACMKYDVLSGM